MSQPNLSVSVYQLRIALLRTSPHIWRRVLVPGQFTLAQLHQILRALFGWSETQPHRFLIRALQEQWPYPLCIAGAGTPPPEPVASPQEFRHMQDLFTLRYILHHLAEMTDHGHDDRRIAEEVRYLRPWLTRGEFRKREANRQLEAAAGANR